MLGDKRRLVKWKLLVKSRIPSDELATHRNEDEYAALIMTTSEEGTNEEIKEEE